MQDKPPTKSRVTGSYGRSRVIVNNLEGQSEKRLWPEALTARSAWKHLRGAIAGWEVQFPKPGSPQSHTPSHRTLGYEGMKSLW